MVSVDVSQLIRVVFHSPVASSHLVQEANKHHGSACVRQMGDTCTWPCGGIRFDSIRGNQSRSKETHSLHLRTNVTDGRSIARNSSRVMCLIDKRLTVLYYTPYAEVQCQWVIEIWLLKNAVTLMNFANNLHQKYLAISRTGYTLQPTYTQSLHKCLI